ncbi:MAG: hypothetical protein IKW31_05740 [Alistipes sp.]|nr:hypothetical protein [Alistipes sp.]
MKRFLALAALVLGLASCQTEPEGLNVNVGGEVDTFVTIAIPDVDTRANSAEGGIKNLVTAQSETNYTIRYIFEVYYGEGVTQKAVQKQVYYTDDMTASFPVRLVSGRHYNFVAWADIVAQPTDSEKMNKALPYENAPVGDNHYDTTNLKNVTIIDNDEHKWVAMDETRDAYTGQFNTAVDGDKTAYSGTKSINIQMTRPFAKLRVITTDMVELTNLGITPTSATVKYNTNTDHYQSFNAVAGKVVETSKTIEEKTHTFNYADVTSYADSKDGKKVLFTDYFFADDNDVVKFQLDVYDAATQNETTLIKHNDFTTDIPVQRNYLTTIQGNVLTDGNNVTVTVENDGAFAGEIKELVASDAKNLQEIINTATDGKQTAVTLVGDIDLSALINAGTLSTRAGENAGLVIPANKVVVLNLNGFNISQTKACTATYSMIVNNGNLTISGNGAVQFTNTAEGGSSTWGTNVIENRTGAVLEINGATISHNGSVNGETNHDTNLAIQNYQGKVTVNSGTITSTQFRSLRDFTAGGEIIINGGTFNGQVWMQGLGNGTSSLTINGGNFSPVDGYDGSSVYITNNSNIVNVAVNGGMFNTKIGCYDATKEGAKGCITGGTFTAAAKENTNAALLAEGHVFKALENGNYTVAELKLNANFADNDWSDIVFACENNYVPESWNVGDTKAMTIGGKDYQIRILGKNHDTYTAGGKAPLTFQIAEVYGSAAMNATQTNTTGWSGSKMRTVTMAEILEVMPVKDAIKAVNKETLKGTRDGLETTSDKLFLLSEVEVNGSVFFSNNFAEGSRYAYYANGGSQIMSATWWLRGPGKSNDIGYTQINMSGYMANGSAEYACGVVFGFCF